MIYIKSNFRKLPATITKLETTGLPLVQSLAIVEDLQMSLQSSCGGVAVAAKEKLENVLNSNPDFGKLKSIRSIFLGENIKDFDFNLTLSQITSLKFAPVTSCDVERSFSAFKNVLTDKRTSLSEENLERLVVVYCSKRQ